MIGFWVKHIKLLENVEIFYVSNRNTCMVFKASIRRKKHSLITTEIDPRSISPIHKLFRKMWRNSKPNDGRLRRKQITI